MSNKGDEKKRKRPYNKREGKSERGGFMKTKGKRRVIQFVILLVSVLFITLGVVRDEHIEVLNKAIRICLECIGIG